jgi:hypothetical protein
MITAEEKYQNEKETEKINTRLADLYDQNRTNDRIILALEKRKKEICEHKRKTQTAGYDWADWPESGFETGVITCKDCRKTLGKNWSTKEGDIL